MLALIFLQVVAAISGNTDLVVAGEKAGSKLAEAQARGIEVKPPRLSRKEKETRKKEERNAEGLLGS